MLVRRFSAAAVQDFHRLSSHILMDVGELGSRNMTVTWIEVPVQSPAVSVEETIGRQSGATVGYDEDSDSY